MSFQPLACQLTNDIFSPQATLHVKLWIMHANRNMLFYGAKFGIARHSFMVAIQLDQTSEQSNWSWHSSRHGGLENKWVVLYQKGQGQGEIEGGGCVGENKQKRTRRGLAHHSTIELSPLITIPSHLPLNVSTIGLGGHRITRLCTITRIILLEELRSILWNHWNLLFWSIVLSQLGPNGGMCVSPTFNEIFSLGWVALAYNMYLLVTFQQFSKGKACRVHHHERAYLTAYM